MEHILVAARRIGARCISPLVHNLCNTNTLTEDPSENKGSGKHRNITTFGKDTVDISART